MAENGYLFFILYTATGGRGKRVRVKLRPKKSPTPYAPNDATWAIATPDSARAAKPSKQCHDSLRTAKAPIKVGCHQRVIARRNDTDSVHA